MVFVELLLRAALGLQHHFYGRISKNELKPNGSHFNLLTTLSHILCKLCPQKELFVSAHTEFLMKLLIQ